ncbi:MAG: bifunctional diaminohydroxyphosphoribosylaminopyrimidine deaminase/5-amino-6-(5-phosphoribosylamino)uracil reductase RibD [Verrucomicrobia bacterium]|nr:bifunctional diaminohydroxyphosphoribosylaminopyrimidine deaminase/5-amino-6-(5-phosphoribosylamino)uracil reductase RibD [Verrucomicrobiota bacterium]
MTSADDIDSRFMERALQLARKGEGLTRPNPPVGAVIVKRGRIVGEGFHRKAGSAHAEIDALKAAGKRAKDADLYVTLEPCSTHGKTPPCTDAILAAGVKRVVIPIRDPNPHNGGRGVRLLQQAGLDVTEGVCADSAERLIEPFATSVIKHRPFITLKLGITVDGRIADSKGKSRWITGPEARLFVQDVRRRVDGVLVGSGTVMADNPGLLPRPAGGRKPYRIIVDTNGRTQACSKVLSDGKGKQTIIAASAGVSRQFIKLTEAAGAQVLMVRRSGKHLSLRDLMKRLGKMGLLHILCEGGGEIAASLIRENLVDEYLFFVSPKFLGRTGRPAVGGGGWSIKDAPAIEFTSIMGMGSDVLITARPE